MTIGPHETTDNIAFERILRDCEYNKRLAAEGDRTGYLYDFKVTIDDEHRATLVRSMNVYVVYDPDMERIVGASLTSGRTTTRGGKPVECFPKQRDFMPGIRRLLEEGKIPTLDQLAAAREARKAAAADAEAAAIEAKRVRAIQAAGVDLYEALKAAGEYIAGHSSIRYSDPLRVQIRDAIAKAEGGAS